MQLTCKLPTSDFVDRCLNIFLFGRLLRCSTLQNSRMVSFGVLQSQRSAFCISSTLIITGLLVGGSKIIILQGNYCFFLGLDLAINVSFVARCTHVPRHDR